MENAARALEMAGGVLIAILIISLFTYMFNHLSEHQAVQTYNQKTEKLQAFNAKYLAYDKTILYGADIISVINQALSNNISVTDEQNTSTTYDQHQYGYFKSSNPYDINIKFKLLNNEDSAIAVQAEYYLKKDVTAGADLDTDGADKEKVEITKIAGYPSEEDISLKSGTEYDLTIFKNAHSFVNNKATDNNKLKKNAECLKNNPILSIMPGEDIKVKVDGDDGIYVKRQTEEFIKKVFKCTNVEFSTTTGRVREMTFEEFDPNDITHIP